MEKTSLYRHFDASGRLLYVGISKNALCRLDGHEAASWYGDISRIEIEHFPSREAAAKAEKIAIRDENPAYNLSRPLDMTMAYASMCLPPLLLARLDEWAKGQRMGRSEAVRHIISVFFERLDGEKGEPE